MRNSKETVEDDRQQSCAYAFNVGGAGVVFWSAEASGDYASDCERGRDEARRLLARCASGVSLPPLAWMIRDMIALGRFGGVEVGFCQEIWAALSRLSSHEDHADNPRPDVRIVEGQGDI